MSSIHPQAAQLEDALQQAIRFHQAGRLSEAEQLYRSILQVVPHHPATNNNLSIALVSQGRLDEAAAVLRRLLAVSPNSVSAYSNLGNILFEMGEPEEAEASYRRALELQPDMLDATKNLATAICKNGRFAESLPWFRRHAELAHGNAQSFALGREPLPTHKLQHDQEQRLYLKGAEAVAAPSDFYLEAGNRVTGRTINPDQTFGDIEARWQASRPQLAVIDNFLTPEALEALRRFCLRSTIWHRSYDDGYLGAMPEHGFACPLLEQIDDELRNTYPAIIGALPLLHWWAFKYDHRLRGTNIHADLAAVNVNFWITPDEANLDPEGGGLEIYDCEAPAEWDFAEYNGDPGRIRDFLDGSHALQVVVPHRQNRVVIFNSNLFHETAVFRFKPGYGNRRINITMLFGERQRAV